MNVKTPILILHHQAQILENLRLTIQQYLLVPNQAAPAFKDLEVVAQIDANQDLSFLLNTVNPFPRLLIIHELSFPQLSASLKLIKQHPSFAFCGVIILGNQEENRKQYLKEGAELYLTYPFNAEQLLNEAYRLILNKTPVLSLELLPPKIAKAIDMVWMKLGQLNYYQILELTGDCTKEEIQDRFHQRSLVLHPDRHRDIKKQHPVTYDKINQIYKKINEAYRVLSHDQHRLHYQLLLLKGKLQYEEMDDLLVSQMEGLDDQGQALLLNALICRYQGDLPQAIALIKGLILRNGSSKAIQSLLNYYEKILLLIQA
jgi:hypothetical protein